MVSAHSNMKNTHTTVWRAKCSMQWIQQEPPKFLVTTDKSTKAYVLWQRNRRYVLFAHETHEQSPYDVISEICWEFVTTQWPVLALVTARPLKAHYTHSQLAYFRKCYAMSGNQLTVRKCWGKPGQGKLSVACFTYISPAQTLAEINLMYLYNC